MWAPFFEKDQSRIYWLIRRRNIFGRLWRKIGDANISWIVWTFLIEPIERNKCWWWSCLQQFVEYISFLRTVMNAMHPACCFCFICAFFVALYFCYVFFLFYSNRIDIRYTYLYIPIFKSESMTSNFCKIFVWNSLLN